MGELFDIRILVLLIGQPGQKTGEEQEGFYLLKKDSQRRMTLTRVLTQDEAKICEVWMRGIHQEGQTVLQMVNIFIQFFYINIRQK